MEILLMKTPQGALVPADADAAERLAKMKAGALIRAEIAVMRNGPFHRKFFSMLDLGFDAFEPPEKQWRGLEVQKNRQRFRKDCIVAAGFYDPVANIRGEVRAEAKSISFARMEQDEFERVYSAVADVLLQSVLARYTRADLDDVVERMIGYV